MADSGTDYSGWSWQQIADAIAPADGSVSPASLRSAATVFAAIQQGLASIAQAVQDAANSLTGDGAWQGPASAAFATSVTSFVTGIQSLNALLTGGAAGGGPVSDLLNQNADTLSWAQEQVQAIDNESASAAAQAGAPTTPSGVVDVGGSMAQQMTAEMLSVLEKLVQSYDQTISDLQNQTLPGNAPAGGTGPGGTGSGELISTGAGSGDGTPDPTAGGDSDPAPAGPDDTSPNDSGSGDPGPTELFSTSAAPSGGGPVSDGSTGSSDDSGSGSVGSWVDQAFSVLEANGVPASELNADDVNLIIQNESGGDPNAINNWDSNAQAGDPSRGLMQTTGETFDAYALPGYNSNIYDPVSNIVAAVRYALATYGSLGNVPGVVAVDSGGSYVGY
jgi:uncharacterized protein YukE